MGIDMSNGSDSGERLLSLWLKMFCDVKIRTACEVSVGPISFLRHFKKFSGNIIGFEPNPVLRKRAASIYPWMKIYEIAIGDHKKTVMMAIREGGSSIPDVRINTPREFESLVNKTDDCCFGYVDVNMDVFSSYDPKDIDLMILDCEGYEWFVLKHMTSLPKMIQIEIFCGNSYKSKIFDWFDSAGYSMVDSWYNNMIYAVV